MSTVYDGVCVCVCVCVVCRTGLSLWKYCWSWWCLLVCVIWEQKHGCSGDGRPHAGPLTSTSVDAGLTSGLQTNVRRKRNTDLWNISYALILYRDNISTMISFSLHTYYILYIIYAVYKSFYILKGNGSWTLGFGLLSNILRCKKVLSSKYIIFIYFFILNSPRS